MSRVDQPDRPHPLDVPTSRPFRSGTARPASRSQRRANVRARLAKAKEHLERNALFALTADQLDTLAVQQTQWEATAYASAAEILRRARAEADAPALSRSGSTYSSRHEMGPGLLWTLPEDEPILLEAVRPKLWPVVEAMIERYRGKEDLELFYFLLHRTFSWVERNSESMPRVEPEISDWLRDGCIQVLRGSVGNWSMQAVK